MKLIKTDNVPIKAWVDGVPLEDAALQQLRNVASLPVIHHHVAVMPDVHFGIGATVGSVIPTLGAIVPAAVGVDIGCGMCAVRTDLTASDLPDDLKPLRTAIERAVPHGRTNHGGKGDRGSWSNTPNRVLNLWRQHLDPGFKRIVDRCPIIERSNHVNHLGTLGGGNHFIEVCLDTEQRVWFMLHSGSRGVGNKIAQIYIEQAKKAMGKELGRLPDKDLAYFTEDQEQFSAYVEALHWAQDYARINRQVMMERVLDAARDVKGLRRFKTDAEVVNCHHNYVAKEHHYGADCYVTRKGAVRAGEGEMGIIPGSMGARSYIVRGKGNHASFCSCSHGAGRVMSRSAAKRRFSLADHAAATAGVECRKDKDVLDETPGAYKDIDAVMAAQSELVDIVHTLKQVVCIKG